MNSTNSPGAVLPLNGLTRRGALVAAAGAGAMLVDAFGRPLGGSAMAQTIKRGGTVRVASPPAKTIDPLVMDSAGSIALVQQVAEYLVWVETDLSLRPVLATAWRTTDGGRTWVFDIRQGVTFHDGRPLTADDVVASFQRLADPTIASAAAAQISFLKKEHITKLGTHRVQFELERPIGQFPYYTHIYNAVILPADYKGDFEKSPIGTGPFRLQSYRPQEGATLVRNETYWDTGKPYVDSLSWQIYDSPQPMILAIQGNQVDVLVGSSLIDARPLLSDPDVRVINTSSAAHRQMCMRVDKKPWDDKRVRQAVALGMRRPEMVQALLTGLGDVGNDHAVAPIYPTKVDVPQRTLDIAKAKLLLAEAGHPQGFEADLYTANYLELPQYAQFVKQMLEPVGIRVNLKIEPLNTYYDHWNQVDFGITDWAARPTPEQILGTAFRTGAEWNAAKWGNAAFDKAVEALEAEPDAAKRDVLATEAARIMNDEVPAVVTYFNGSVRPARKTLLNVEGNISEYLDLSKVSFA